MYKKIILLALVCFLSFVIYGCTVRTYSVTKDRVDQDLGPGNRGYLMGASRVTEEKPRKTTRQLQIFEVEMGRPSRIDRKRPAVPESGVDSDISVGQSSRESEQAPAIKTVIAPPVDASKVMVMKKYTVLKGDTLQSISKRFFGTTKRWKDIYEINQEILKKPDDIYPGQIIDIPIEEMAGTK